MKNLLFKISVILILFAACEPDFEHESVDYNFYVMLAEPFNSMVSNVTVKLSHQSKTIYFNQKVESDGTVNFYGIDPGFYNVSLSYNLEESIAEEILKTDLSDSLRFNYFGEVNALKSGSDTLKLYPAFSSPLIIREFYYAGVFNTKSNRVYSGDQYLEIYNNSDEEQRIDGLIIAEHASFGNNYNEWSNIRDSVVLRWLWQIPPEAQKTLAPWKSIIIARDAIDHKTDSLGAEESPVNLSQADYEFYMSDVNGQDIDAPAENMKEIVTVYRGNDITFHTRNGGGILIARATTNDMDKFTENNRIIRYSVTGSTFRYFYKIPNSWILDAVEVLEDANSGAYKRFPTNIDAGFTYNSDAGSGTCISRKLVSRVNGKAIYMDTNNSTIDFLRNQIPNPNLND